MFGRKKNRELPASAASIDPASADPASSDPSIGISGDDGRWRHGEGRAEPSGQEFNEWLDEATESLGEFHRGATPETPGVTSGAGVTGAAITGAASGFGPASPFRAKGPSTAAASPFAPPPSTSELAPYQDFQTEENGTGHYVIAPQVDGSFTGALQPQPQPQPEPHPHPYPEPGPQPEFGHQSEPGPDYSSEASWATDPVVAAEPVEELPSEDFSAYHPEEVEADLAAPFPTASVAAPSVPPSRTFDPADDRLAPQEGRLVALNLAKSFGSRKVLKDVSISVDQGEVVGLLGPNGAGKTTSFYMVCGLLTPDEGRVLINGKDITRKAVFQRARLGLGYLPQEASIFRGLSVEKNILAILETRYRKRKDRRDKLEELLDEFTIQHIRKSPALALSGGERRRVEIARALAADPDFVLLDEPFAGIDPIAVGDIRKLVSQLKNRGIGILITDHNVRETLGVVDRAYIIFNGAVLKHGYPDEIIADQTVRDVYLGQQFSL